MRGLEQQYDEVGQNEAERRGDGQAENGLAARHAEGARRVWLGTAKLHEGQEEERHVDLRACARVCGSVWACGGVCQGVLRVCAVGVPRGSKGVSVCRAGASCGAPS